MSAIGLGAIGIDLRGRTGGTLNAVCPACSHLHHTRRSSLSVDIDRGMYNCHRCGWSGRIATGGKDSYGAPAQVAKVYTTPDYRTAQLSPQAVAWLTKRGITEAVYTRANLASKTIWMPQTEQETTTIAFPYTRNGAIVNVKYRDGKKNFRMEKDAERILYGLDDIAADRPLVWVEGELDKLACEVAGYRSCVSIPNGAPPANAKNLASHYEPIDTAAPYLAPVRLHIIAVDNDDPGRGLRDELVRRLGLERCKVALWPEGCKDANDVLIQFGAAHLAKLISEARDIPVSGSFAPDDLADDLSDYYERGATPGVQAGTPNIAAHYRPIPGKWTVVNGIPGNGKTAWLDWFMYSLMLTEGWRFAVCSPENQPLHRHLAKLIRLRVGKPFGTGPHDRMTPAERDEGRAWLQGYVRFLSPEEDDRGGYALDNILDLCRVEIARFGVKGIVIDPWNELEHNRPPGMREDEYIARSLITLRTFARKHQVHIWMVAHPVKLERRRDGSNPIPRLWDLSGGSMWANKCDFGITIHRDDPTVKGPTSLHIQKVKDQPEGGYPGVIDLDFDTLTGRYADATTTGTKAVVDRGEW